MRHENEIYICRGGLELGGIEWFLPLDKAWENACPKWELADKAAVSGKAAMDFDG